MRHALLLAERGLGRVAPNPAVGCVVTDVAGSVVGRGWTQPGGRPHAETEALRMAGEKARGGTAYVTLEPCSHHGKTAPCADALVEAGINRCVVALKDSYPEVNGRGIRRLHDAGIEVEVGLLGSEAEEANLGFLTKVREHRPMVTLKIASSLDGRIATRSGDSKWITGALARAHGHKLRATHDAILVGSGTVLADDPELTCRLPGLEDRSPVRVVLDGRLRTPLTSKLVASAGEVRTVLITNRGQDKKKRQPYADAGVEAHAVIGDEQGHPHPPYVMAALGELGLTRVLIEGGAAVAAAYLKAGLVDRIHWFRAPGVIGGDGLASIAEIGLDSPEHMNRFERTALFAAGADTVEIYRKKSS
ncbi:bifunctional diaminohydroxyphosphoribosylaminopyrimidine deaminase/5-amino-6-(5-phosphoribosylamino)uracil reductase RibD [Dongia sp.]|uniref:bifunctional diaminohydroxyphosphoribosylaminopyrimidine deaminase/5-amino-6-(5-phosphoribosylamino)uracil reductase RibD n=1 Tax=Dongia sp. TaxID=1977262 RepID=UPI0037506C92